MRSHEKKTVPRQTGCDNTFTKKVNLICFTLEPMKQSSGILIISIIFVSYERYNGNLCKQFGYKSDGYISSSTISELIDDSIELWLSVTDTVMWYKNGQVVHVVNDPVTFNKRVRTTNDDFEFNFKEYTLLIGYVFIHSGPAVFTEQRLGISDETILEQIISYMVTALRKYRTTNMNARIKTSCSISC